MSVDHIEQPDRSADLLRVLGYDAARADLDLLLLGRRPGQRPPGPRGDPARAVGVHQHHLAAAADAAVQRVAGPTPSSTGPATAARCSPASPAAPWSATTAGSSCRWAARLEQVDMTSRMVASASLTTGSTQWPSVLRGCGGHDAFLRTYRGLHTDREAAQFLIFDARFPRSIMHGLVAGRRLPAEGHASTTRAGRAAVRVRGDRAARASCGPGWSTPTIDDLLSNLDDEMTAVQDVARRGDRGGGHELLRRRRPDRLDHARGPAEMRLEHRPQDRFRLRLAGVKSSYNEARMTPAATTQPDRLEQPGQHRAGRLELHLHRLLGHRRHHLRAARAARAADRARPGRGRDPRRRPDLGHRPPGGAERPRLAGAARSRRDRHACRSS